MSVLGIDYGLKRIGVALSFWQKGAQPLGVFSKEQFWQKLPEWQESLEIDKIVVGLPEGRLVEKVKIFGRKIEENFHLPVLYQDETLSTKEAQKKLILNKVRLKKRKILLDAYSAVLILEEFLRRKFDTI